MYNIKINVNLIKLQTKFDYSLILKLIFHTYVYPPIYDVTIYTTNIEEDLNYILSLY